MVDMFVMGGGMRYVDDYDVNAVDDVDNELRSSILFALIRPSTSKSRSYLSPP